MTDVEELGATLAALREAFEALGVAWAVGGSLASAAYGEPRATNDVDVVAALDRDAALALPRLLPDFYCDLDDAYLDEVAGDTGRAGLLADARRDAAPDT